MEAARERIQHAVGMALWRTSGVLPDLMSLCQNNKIQSERERALLGTRGTLEEKFINYSGLEDIKREESMRESKREVAGIERGKRKKETFLYPSFVPVYLELRVIVCDFMTMCFINMALHLLPGIRLHCVAFFRSQRCISSWHGICKTHTCTMSGTASLQTQIHDLADPCPVNCELQNVWPPCYASSLLPSLHGY